MKKSKRSSEIRNEQGELIFSAPQIEAPESWSQFAVDIAARKYLRHQETSVFQMVDRVIGALRKGGLSTRQPSTAELVAECNHCGG